MSDQRIRRVLRVTSPADLLALVPVLFGFHPEDSVVLVSVGPAGQPFHARADLPERRDDAAGLAGYLASVALRNGGDRFAVLVYTDRAQAAEALAATLRRRFQDAGLGLVCAARADGRRWWWLDRPGSAGPGTPYDLTAHRFTAEAVLEGKVTLGNRAELAASLVGHDEHEAAVIGRLAAEQLPSGRRQLLAELRWVRRRVTGCLRNGLPLQTAEAARLARDIRLSVPLRDAAWSEMDHDNAAAHVELWRDLVRRVPSELRASPAALLAFAAWLSGNGALAWCAVECSQDADPDYSLAALVAQALAGAVPPSTWTPLTLSEETLLGDGLAG